MQQFEIFNGNRYLFTVPPSENPEDVLREERRNRRNPRLRMVMVERGVRTEVEAPGSLEPVDTTFNFAGEEDDE